MEDKSFIIAIVLIVGIVGISLGYMGTETKDSDSVGQFIESIKGEGFVPEAFTCNDATTVSDGTGNTYTIAVQGDQLFVFDYNSKKAITYSMTGQSPLEDYGKLNYKIFVGYPWSDNDKD